MDSNKKKVEPTAGNIWAGIGIGFGVFIGLFWFVTTAFGAFQLPEKLFWIALPIMIGIMVVVAIFSARLIARLMHRNIPYYQTTYYRCTGVSEAELKQDTQEAVGLRGEYNLYRALAPLEDEDHVLFFNVFIAKPEDKRPRGKDPDVRVTYLDLDYTELDAMMVTPSGIYVFEVKNYYGTISGSEFDQKWKQVYDKIDKYGIHHTNTRSFYNPIIQNKEHIRHLREFLKKNNIRNADSLNICSIIVFDNRSIVRDLKWHDKKLRICNTRDVIEAYHQLEGRAPAHVYENPEDRQRIIAELNKWVRAHVPDSIREKQVAAAKAAKERAARREEEEEDDWQF